MQTGANLGDTVRQFCSAHRLHLNTDLGQHYLIDEEILQTIVTSAALRPDDVAVEIGPGIGVLTRKLLEKARAVLAIELDKRVIPLLHEFVGKSDKLQVIQDNALRVPLPEEPYKIVANIPYHITSPLLRHAFLESKRIPASLTLLIQREVAEKICDEKDAGMLTILVRLFGKPRIAALVPPSAFLPPPKVNSAVLHIECFAEPLVEPQVIEEIFTLTKLAFGQKRKMLRNTLGTLPDGMEQLSQANIDPERRPQTLSIEEWIALARSFGA
ncbi:MAG: 16S rRNA (adenine(1518)-N(6)/adenine(1519)-N(6))-dimethyltransferase RsmA [Candidatus Peribacteraceae bacterium]|nr:16S rRNA (adenine(1518)-N(6)/adenine(1519)-N(6))-dimethyltransferase RsmA [Candidatus Peribacteraceae bacterium]